MPALESCSDIMCFSRFNDFDSHCFSRKIYQHDKKLLNGIILIYGLLFLGLEIYHEINRYFFFGYYDFSSIPFQFCSIPIYLCLILPFIKNEKIRMPIFYYIGIYCMIAGIFPLLFGQGQLCRWSNIFDVIRSFVWHVPVPLFSPLSLNLKFP